MQSQDLKNPVMQSQDLKNPVMQSQDLPFIFCHQLKH